MIPWSGKLVQVIDLSCQIFRYFWGRSGSLETFPETNVFSLMDGGYVASHRLLGGWWPGFQLFRFRYLCVSGSFTVNPLITWMVLFTVDPMIPWIVLFTVNQLITRRFFGEKYHDTHMIFFSPFLSILKKKPMIDSWAFSSLFLKIFHTQVIILWWQFFCG